MSSRTWLRWLSQETLWLSVRSSLIAVQEITMCTGSDTAQETLNQESFTLKDKAVVSVRKASMLVLLHRRVFTAFPRTSGSLMLEPTTVLWLHVERYCLGMKLSGISKVNHSFKCRTLTISMICINCLKWTMQTRLIRFFFPFADAHFQIEVLVLLSIIRSAVLLLIFIICLLCTYIGH